MNTLLFTEIAYKAAKLIADQLAQNCPELVNAIDFGLDELHTKIVSHLGNKATANQPTTEAAGVSAPV